MKNKDFHVSRTCFVCPYRAQAHEREHLADERPTIFRWQCVVWGRSIDCLSRADALEELRRQCTIEVAFARHARQLTMAEYFALDLRYQFSVDEREGVAYCNGKKYGYIEKI